MTLTLSKYDAYIFRRYITDLEYRSKMYEASLDKISLLEESNNMWEETAINYKSQYEATDAALLQQIEIQAKKDEQYEIDVKDSHKKGMKMGAGIATVTVFVLCLLIK